MAKITLNLPTEILENIIQYVGPCRLYKDELIPLLNFKDDRIERLESFLKDRKDRTIILFYEPDEHVKKIEHDKIWKGPYANYHTEYYYSTDGLYSTDSWILWTRWNITKSGHQFRSFTYEYVSATKELLFKYKRRRKSFPFVDINNMFLLNEIYEVKYEIE